MDIILGDQQNIFTTENDPVFQDWGPLPNPYRNQMYYHPNAGFVPAPGVTTFKIKDVIGAAETAQFSEFRLLAYQNYLTGNPVAWLDPACYTDIGYPNSESAPMELTENGLEFEFTPVLQNLNLLAAGSYSFYHHFKIQGKSGPIWQDISSYEHRIRLYVTNTPVYVSPASHHYVHVHGNPLPSKAFNLYGSDWKIIGNPKVVLSSSWSGTHVSTVTDDTGTYQEVYVDVGMDGVSGFEAKLDDFYDQVGVFDPSVLSGQLVVKQGSSTIVGYIPYTITVVGVPTFTASPNALHFSGVKGVSEPEPQNITFLSTQDYTIEASPWLTTHVETQVVDGLTQTVIVVRPISIINFAVGTYTGYVKLMANVNGVDQELITTVVYDVQDFVVVDYTPESVSFTLDPKNVTFSTLNDETYFVILLRIIAFDFFSEVENLTELEYKIPLFKKNQVFNIGQIVDRLMKRFPKPGSLGQFEYYPAEVSFNVQEKNTANNEVVRSFESEVFKFVAGYSPLQSSNGACILSRNLKPTRITKTTKTFVNMYMPAGTYYLGLKIDDRPDIFLQALTIDQDQVMSYALDFAQHNVEQGSVAVFRMLRVGDPTFKKEYSIKTFRCLPAGDFSNMIIWEDCYKVRGSFEFTGGFRYATELDHVTHTYWRNMEEFLEKFRTNKKSKFFINTGYITKADVQIVEDLIANKKAWLVLPDGELLNLVPLNKDFLGEDTDKALFEYEVEFQINEHA